ncbi:MAG: hypothetical protein J7454_05875 [Roseiflexus sp.]|jgi:hypothetical protein|nr:hypothetical protein [Chloroflexus sp.]MBO9341551.1 hypothetical protein [Roseiflexus sp.]
MILVARRWTDKERPVGKSDKETGGAIGCNKRLRFAFIGLTVANEEHLTDLRRQAGKVGADSIGREIERWQRLAIWNSVIKKNKNTDQRACRSIVAADASQRFNRCQ